MPIEKTKKEPAPSSSSTSKAKSPSTNGAVAAANSSTIQPISSKTAISTKLVVDAARAVQNIHNLSATPPGYREKAPPVNASGGVSHNGGNNTQLDPKKLFELVSKNYETWSQAMYKQFQDEENYSPFPNEDDEASVGIGASDRYGDSQPIFNYSLLEALEKASAEFSDKINKMDDNEVINEMNNRIETLVSGSLGASLPNTAPKRSPSTPPKETEESTNTHRTTGNSKNAGKRIIHPSESLLKENEIDFLRSKISQMIGTNAFNQNINGAPFNPRKREGFSLYDTQDEEGLHEGNADAYYDENGEYHDDDQDDYDLEEINNDDPYSYGYPPTHHIEVELNAAPECDEHGLDGCDCPVYEYDDGERYRGGEFGDEGPSCEFTFEYDHTGKLVPTYSNVEEKLRLMSLQSRISAANGSNGSKSRNGVNASNMKLPSINELNIGSHNLNSTDSLKASTKKKNKKKKKKKNASSETKDQPPRHHTGAIGAGCCLFCEYELVFGSQPRQMMKWYDQRIRRDEQRREEIKKKLENAKSKAIKKQREMRQKQLQQQQQNQQQTNEAGEEQNIAENTEEEKAHDVTNSSAQQQHPPSTVA
ncbi:uncharacterized protein RJT20DRAFT_34422 [Scheffersomyces xylosifermentans]|uniref:uncharacterized protein n=1 Tax=Scheffersomyces xylosifermentans TaxID=1304137 RepID=UPI00315D0EE0